jgi:hypothetical protein
MAADRRVAYQLQISAGKSLKTLADLTAEAQASAAAVAALDAAQKQATVSLQALGAARGALKGRSSIGAQTAATQATAAQAAAATPAAPAAGAAPAAPVAPVAPVPTPAPAPAPAPAPSPAPAATAAKLTAADRELARQRAALVRQELGAIAGKAKLEEERLQKLRADLAAENKLTQAEEDLIKKRLALIREDVKNQQDSLRKRGVDPTKAFGATGTRQTTIGSGVLSGFFDQLLGDTGDAGVKLGDLRDAAGRADTSLKTLAGALGVVSPGAQAAATAAGDLVGSLEVLLTPAGATVGAMAAVGVAFGAAGAAAVASVLHIAEVADELERLQALGAPELLPPETAREARAAADAIAAIQPALSAIAAVIAGEVAPQLREMAVIAVAGALTISRALEATEVSALGLVESLGQAYINSLLLPLRTVLSAIEQIQTLAAESLEAIGGPLAGAIPRGFARAAAALGQGLDEAGARAAASVGRAARRVAEGAVAGYSAGLASLTGDSRADAEALVAAITAARVEDGGGGPVRMSGGVETGVAEYGDAVEAAEDALQRLRELGQDSRDALLSPWDELVTRFARAREELAGLRTAAGPAGAALADAAERALDAQQATATAELVTRGVEAANREIAAQDAAARAAVEARAGRPGEAVDRFGSAVGQLGQGNAIGAIGAATGIPQVQVVGAALDALAQLGQLSEEELEQRGEDFARAVAAGLEVLPSVLVEVLPELRLSLAEAIGEALLSLPDAIGAAVYEAVTGQEVESRGAFREGLRVASAAGQEGSAEEGAIALAVAAIRGSRSRQAAARTLSSGVGLPGVGGRAPERGGERALVVRGSGPGLARAIQLEADAPYGRRWGVR